MGFHLPLFLVLCVLPRAFSENNTDVTVKINGNATLGQTSDPFICATMDWWPPEKCNYGQCPWERASVLNLNLSHPNLAKAIRAFNPLRIRIGGTLQDKVIYEVGELDAPCNTPFTKDEKALFGVSNACLSMKRWKELNQLFKKSKAVVTFGLNALYGKRRLENGTWVDPFNTTNARDFIRHTFDMLYPVDSWELGNELSGRGIGANIGAQDYAKDLINLKNVIREIYGDGKKPLLAAPGGFVERPWFDEFLKATGPGILDVVTHHIYNLGPGDDPHIVNKLVDPTELGGISQTFKEVKEMVDAFGNGSVAWVGEAGGAYNSGSNISSSTFLNSFWYLDQLGLSAAYNTKVYCRQVLIGGNYGLLDKRTFLPNPDYYGALLFHRLMGNIVLPVEVQATSHLRAYAHCRKSQPGLTLLLINLNVTGGFTVTVRDETDKIISDKGVVSDDLRYEYHLTAKGMNHLSRTVLLNGIPLGLTPKRNIPPLLPVTVPALSPIWIGPLSISFVVFPDYKPPACRKIVHRAI